MPLIVRIIAVLCLVVAVAKALTVPQLCKNRNFGYKIQDPEDCHSFYMCLGDWGQYNLDCGSGYRFNETQQRCIKGKCPPCPCLAASHEIGIESSGYIPALPVIFLPSTPKQDIGVLTEDLFKEMYLTINNKSLISSFHIIPIVINSSELNNSLNSSNFQIGNVAKNGSLKVLSKVSNNDWNLTNVANANNNTSVSGIKAVNVLLGRATDFDNYNLTDLKQQLLLESEKKDIELTAQINELPIKTTTAITTDTTTRDVESTTLPITQSTTESPTESITQTSSATTTELSLVTKSTKPPSTELSTEYTITSSSLETKTQTNAYGESSTEIQNESTTLNPTETTTLLTIQSSTNTNSESPIESTTKVPEEFTSEPQTATETTKQTTPNEATSETTTIESTTETTTIEFTTTDAPAKTTATDLSTLPTVTGAYTELPAENTLSTTTEPQSTTATTLPTTLELQSTTETTLPTTTEPQSTTETTLATTIEPQSTTETTLPTTTELQSITETTLPTTTEPQSTTETTLPTTTEPQSTTETTLPTTTEPQSTTETTLPTTTEPQSTIETTLPTTTDPQSTTETKTQPTTETQTTTEATTLCTIEPITTTCPAETTTCEIQTETITCTTTTTSCTSTTTTCSTTTSTCTTTTTTCTTTTTTCSATTTTTTCSTTTTTTCTKRVTKIGSSQEPATASDKETADLNSLCLNHKDGYFIKHSKQCNKYYTCFRKQAYVHVCPGQFYFDEKSQMCNYPDAVDCKMDNKKLHINDKINKPTVRPITAQSQSLVKNAALILKPDDCRTLKSGTFVRDPNNCNKYYVCLNGYAVALYCPRGQYFDIEGYVCNFKALVKNCPV